MGSVGDAYDNAMCESFFATLECESVLQDGGMEFATDNLVLSVAGVLKAALKEGRVVKKGKDWWQWKEESPVETRACSLCGTPCEWGIYAPGVRTVKLNSIRTARSAVLAVRP